MSDGEHFLSGGPNNHPACHRTAKSHVDPQSVENFRRKLKYFFMSPCQKYRARGRKPWKMMLQILKIAIITFQLVSFGLSNEMMVTFKEGNIVAFKHFFLKNYQDRNKDYALYTKHEVHDHILYIINRYLHLQDLTVDNHAFERIDEVFTPLSVCQELYRHANILPVNETFDIDPHVETECLYFYPFSLFKKDDLENDMNLTLDFQRLLAVNIYLKVKAINLQTVHYKELPDCYDFAINELTNYDVCSILLGTATMLVWTGVMRYFSFFQKYYILILTLQAALPNVIRFSFCAVMIFLSYCFCGWIVLGPHHENFRSFNTVANCLFSMINGDEIYSTFTKIRDKNDLVWMFSRMYIYTFVPLFTFMILSLFIALFTDTYETIKRYQKHGAPLSELQAFIAECKDPPNSGKYMVDEESSTFWCLCAPCVNCT
ncbi:hypothetical protein cypCar_00027296 [Cyprinus carpio]|nr:hypothetical protein cypCar_00027296 [Cyprinus carpio]